MDHKLRRPETKIPAPALSGNSRSDRGRGLVMRMATAAQVDAGRVFAEDERWRLATTAMEREADYTNRVGKASHSFTKRVHGLSAVPPSFAQSK